ncbi:transcriptional regulator, LuxR family [Catenulispora acidiphila DSM 44928]|uniref:Transcriptional regulator, LuxR family n=1 Tax=Catenulispora acidiphila (strain DSM 44928 / JCM 14897 / NBRC 102108 / NRRL B-24433 / ID139908) TaxID=479433 RepID=C7QHK9_CATAD|nr:helix-turn-helix transcriptional regulator [Catenulispora acidiphila]ACU71034.1 transcriptional regulator, LuxR family [Catenulispora acidiphila DSM 44928]
MTIALPGPAPRPRPLPADEPLSPEDYRRVVGVVEAVDHAGDLAEFRERLVTALRSWFGYSGVTVLHGETAADAVDRGCGVLAGYSAEFLATYAAQGWEREDPFRDEGFLQRLAEAGVVRLTDISEGARFREEFLVPRGIADKAAMLIDAAPSGVLWVGLAVPDGVGRVSDRDLAVLRVLRRHLTPLAVEQLARNRSREASRGDWDLTPREWDVADLAAQGLTNRQIAARLFIGVDTVKKHLTRVLAATSCGSRTQLALLFTTRGTPS